MIKHRYPNIIFISLSLIYVSFLVYFPRNSGDGPKEFWNGHRVQLTQRPIQSYLKDRSRIVFGYIRDEEDSPVANAKVSVLDIDDSLRELSKDWRILFEGFKPEFQVTTDNEGRFEFHEIPIGSKAFIAEFQGCIVSRAPIAIQDGVGARVDLEIPRCHSLNIDLPDGNWDATVIPLGWSTQVIELQANTKKTVFDQRGGSFEKGCILLTQNGVTEFGVPFDSSTEIVHVHEFIKLASPAQIEQFISDTSNAHLLADQRFNFLTSKRSEPLSSEVGLSMRAFLSAKFPLLSIGNSILMRHNDFLNGRDGDLLAGETASPFSFVLLMHPSFKESFVCKSDAAAEFYGPPSIEGEFLVSGYTSNGDLTYSKGVKFPLLELPKVFLSRLDVIDFEEETGRVVGFILNPPNEKTSVVMQDSESFRRFVRQVEAEKSGFFEFRNVPRKRPYFLFYTIDGHTAVRNVKTFLFSGCEEQISWEHSARKLLIKSEFSHEFDFVLEELELNNWHEILSLECNMPETTILNIPSKPLRFTIRIPDHPDIVNEFPLEASIIHIDRDGLPRTE